MDLILKQGWPTTDETNMYPRDPPKNDVAVFRSAATENLGAQSYRVINHHTRAFETNGGANYSGMNSVHHRKTQHFIRGKIPGGSHDNTLLYGTKSFPGGIRVHRKDTNEPEGFLYGTSAVKRYERKNPARRPNNKLMLEEITDQQRTKLQKLAMDEDNYLSRYYERKAREQSEFANEKRKDLEMLKDYNPWGKPGGGAPRGYKNHDVDANLTKHVRDLKQENYQRTGAGGGGSPNRTTSGTIVTSLKLNPEIRFQANQHNADIDPRLRYRPDHAYGKELEALVQESKNKKDCEKRKSIEEEKRQVESGLFGNQTAIRSQRKEVMQQTSSQDNVYDPWGKGYGGLPERQENGKIVKNVQRLNDESKAEYWQGFGIFSNRSLDSIQNGNVVSRKKATLSKNTYGQPVVRDFSPKEKPYNPWGRPGAGAPLKDDQGNVIATTTGRLTHANTEGSAALKRDPERKKEYLKTLEKQRQEVETLREEEKTSYNKPNEVNVVSWVRQGKVGRPNYDSETNEIRANPKGTSDVTREKFQIRRLKNGNSKFYFDDLQEMAEERHKRRQLEKATERKLSFDHVNTMNNFWGRPGGGAPVTKDQALFPRKHSGELLPTNSSMFR